GGDLPGVVYRNLLCRLRAFSRSTEVSRPSRRSLSGAVVMVLSRTGDKIVLCSRSGEPGTLETFSSPVV
ncbi:hypothetical protein L195_g062950, partial [Trifolium pratense]